MVATMMISNISAYGINRRISVSILVIRGDKLSIGADMVNNIASKPFVLYLVAVVIDPYEVLH